MEDAVIVGAGIAGLAVAVALKRVGVKALVLERSDDLRITGAALGLYPNAWLALDALGASHKLTSIYAVIQRASVTNLSTGAIQEISLETTNGNDGIRPRTLHRKALLKALAEELPADSIRFSCKITAIETQEQEGSSTAFVHLEGGTVIKAKVLIGCDGVHSIVARWLGLAEPVYSGRSAVRGLAVYPQGHGLKQAAHQIVGSGKRAGFAPVTDKELYWFLVCNESPEADLRGDPEAIQREVIENYAKDFPETYLEVVKHADLSTLSWAPLMLRKPWNVAFGNLSKQNITVAGDAMHPMTPDLAQGGCLALEDAVVLGRHIGACVARNGGIVPREIVKALSDYAEVRRWRATWVIAGSFLSGWIQDGGSTWGLKFIRDAIFYKFIFKKLVNVARYDCGKLA